MTKPVDVEVICAQRRRVSPVSAAAFPRRYRLAGARGSSAPARGRGGAGSRNGPSLIAAGCGRGGVVRTEHCVYAGDGGAESGAGRQKRRVGAVRNNVGRAPKMLSLGVLCAADSDSASKTQRVAGMALSSRLLERSGPNDHQMGAKRPPFRTHHGTTLPPPVQPLQIPPRRSARPAQTGRNGRRLLRNGSIIADITMSSSIALQACLGRCVWPPRLWPRG